jgi:hypothetical protein
MGKWSTYARRGSGSRSAPASTLLDWTTPVTTTNTLEGSHRYLANSLTPAATWHLQTLKLNLQRAGAGGGNVTAGVWSDFPGKPGTLLYESAAVDTSAIPTSMTLQEFAFTAATLTGGVTYWIGLLGPNCVSPNFVLFQRYAAGSPYIIWARSTGPTWVSYLPNNRICLELVGTL